MLPGSAAGWRGRDSPWLFACGYGLSGGTPGRRRGANALLIREPLVSLYPAVLFPASPADEAAGWQPGPGGARMIAIRVADLRAAARHGSGKDGRTALTAAGTGPVRSGDLGGFCKPVAVAPALVRRDGRGQAAGHPAGHVRLGVIEPQLDGRTGMEDGVGPAAGGGEDTAPYPQLRDLLVTDASTRGTLAVVTGPSGGVKAEAEQQLLDRALIEYGHVFTKDRIWVLDRNFPGVARIKKITKVTHVLIRLRSSITLRRVSEFFPDGSWLADLSGSGEAIRMR